MEELTLPKEHVEAGFNVLKKNPTLRKEQTRKSKPPPELDHCNVCGKPESRLRYFVAVPLPEIMHLCQDDYDRLKGEAKRFVRKFLGDKA
jgi:hypothetical protein